MIAVLLGAGCVFSTAPRDNAEFAAITALGQLDGRYRNAGDGGADAPTAFLSEILFRGILPPLDHATVTAVALRASDANSLIVQALGPQEAVLAERALVAGRDFTLVDGRLLLRHRWALLGYSPSNETPDDPLVGPRTESTEFGLDRRGDAKFRSRFSGGGLVYLLVPVYLHERIDVRFERLP